MGTVGVLRWVYLLSTLVLVQGVETESKEMIEPLGRQGPVEHQLIVSLVNRLDKQEEQIQSQEQKLDKQQIVLKNQEDQLKYQLKALEKQQQLLNRQDDLLQSQSLTLGKMQQHLNRQETQLKVQSDILEKHMLLMAKLDDQLMSQSNRFDKQTNVVQQNADNSLPGPFSVGSSFLLKHQESTITQQQNLLTSGLRNGTDIKSRFDKYKNNSGGHLAIHRYEAGEPRFVNSDARDVVRSAQGSDDMKQKRLVLGTEGVVAFHAVIDKQTVDHIGIGQKIVFDNELENLGGAYHNQHGIFIAPVDGVYLFSVSIMSWKIDHPEFWASLMKDGVVLARVYGHGDSSRHDQGSVTAVTQLRQGNEVWVENTGRTDDSIDGDRFSTFTGCLLYSL